MNARTLLKIDASARREGSLSRTLTARLANGLTASGVVRQTVERDLLDGIGFVDPEWISANSTPADDRDVDANARLAESDMLVDELLAADIVVIGCPIYNFGPPAVLKAWVDQIARARRTFAYSDTGPKGLLENKQAYVIMSSGGTEVDSAIDFATPYLRHVLGFVGIHDVTVVKADRTMMREDAEYGAIVQIDELLAAARNVASVANDEETTATMRSPHETKDPSNAMKVNL